MADVVLKDGRELIFDLDAITIAEYRTLMDPARDDQEGDDLVGKCAGLEPGEVGALGQHEWRRVMRAFFQKATRPLEDEKNSPGAST